MPEDTQNAGRHVSVWLDDAPQTAYPPLDSDDTADVAVIGGGITGLTTALLLQRAGYKVAVLEAGRIGCGVTGASTAKLTSLHRMIYSEILSKYDEQAARTYAEANEAGLARIAAFAEEAREAGIDCEFQRQTAYTYTCDEKRVHLIHDEIEAAKRAGLPVEFVTEMELPFPVKGAVALPDQGQFNPYRYCVALARTLEQGGARILEMSRILDVERGDSACRVQTGGATLTAQHVVVATLLPIVDSGAYFARTHPSRSYGIAVTLDGPVPNGMYINIDHPTRSVRPLPDGNGIIFVGEEHKVGQDDDTQSRYTALEAWAREHFRVTAITHRWSAQDYMSADSIPYIGDMPNSDGRIWLATGYSKWGLTMGTAAAMMLADRIQGHDNPWAALFDSTRANVVASAKKFVTENMDVAKHFIGDRLRAMRAVNIEDLLPGSAAIVEREGEKLAVYRDDLGELHACSPICTHLGCYVNWNNAEKSWDCPCHGSRFDYKGRILQGPAVKPLESKDVSTVHTK